MKVPVSIIIPILNEASNLGRALASVSWADEVFVVDSGSTDRSQRIAHEAGATVVQFQFNGIWPKKKNWALANLPFRNEWVFILDADETLPPEIAVELSRLIEQDGAGCTGYWINRRFMFMGTWLKHAYYPNWNLRFFKHALGRYEKLVEGATHSGDNEVHEHIIVEGATGRLKAEMDHYAFPSIGVFVEKHNRYSNWEAQLQIEGALDRGGRHGPQSLRTRCLRGIKRLSHHLPFRPTLRFLYVYIFQRGFLDGAEGYYFARLHAIYEFLSVAKAVELRGKMNREPVQEPLLEQGSPAKNAA